MKETTPVVDHLGPILGQYEALEALIGEGTDPMHVRALLDGINAGFRQKLDELDTMAG